MYAYLCTYIFMYVYYTHSNTYLGPFILRMCLRVCMSCVQVRISSWARTRPHRLRALRAAVDFRVRRLAGFLRGVCLQREHRRVEHRSGVKHEQCMRRFRPAHATPRKRSVGIAKCYIYVCVFMYVYMYTHTHTHTHTSQMTALCLRTLRAAVDLRVLGSQAFYRASAFNANIGAWNTAAVTGLTSVCAAFGPAARHRRRP